MKNNKMGENKSRSLTIALIILVINYKGTQRKENKDNSNRENAYEKNRSVTNNILS